MLGCEPPGYTPRPECDLLTLALRDFAPIMLAILFVDRPNLKVLAGMDGAKGWREFMLTIAPLPISNDTEPPTNPIAIV
ncbi:MAG: hypothetical protein P8K27_05165 [Gammaproteobacteria bacterium]|nr:hypothetical protein [Gammaproteobacteria bacterium]